MEVKRAVLYARVSYDDHTREGRNLQGQLDMCRTYALEKGWSIVAELAEEDRGASGARLDLPQLNVVLEWARQRRFDVLVVRELDRLARSLPKQLLVESILTKAGVKIEYVIGEYPDTAEGTFLKNVRAAIAELERLKIAERTTRGKILAVQAGNVMVANRPPYGYEKYYRNGQTKLRIREDEARIVRLIFAWYGQGDEEGIKRSMGKIAQRLIAMGVPTYFDLHPHLANRKSRRVGFWSIATIQAILREPAYKGQWHYLKHHMVGGHKVPRPVEEQIAVAIPAIVNEATWLAAQTRRGQPGTNAGPVMRQSKYLLTSHIVCGLCHARLFGMMSRGSKAKSSGYTYYYGCGNRLFGTSRPRSCNLPYYAAEKLETAVWNWVEARVADRDVLAHELLVLEATWVERTATLRTELAQVQARLAQCETQQQTLLDRYLDGTLSRAAWGAQDTPLRSMLHQLTQEQATLTAQLASGNITEAQKASLHKFAGRLHARLQAASDLHAAKHHLLKVLNLQVVLDTDGAGKFEAHVSCLLGPLDAPGDQVPLSAQLALPPGRRLRASKGETACIDATGTARE